MEGKRGFIRERDGLVVKMVLAGGTLLQKGDVQITGGGKQKGRIQSVMRKATGSPYNAFVTADPVPFHVTGRTLVVQLPDGHTYGYLVEELKKEGSLTHIVIANPDPGFEMDEVCKTTLMFYPFTNCEGVVTFTIDDLVVFTSQEVY